jgi:hypothetical protein
MVMSGMESAALARDERGVAGLASDGAPSALPSIIRRTKPASAEVHLAKSFSNAFKVKKYLGMSFNPCSDQLPKKPYTLGKI